MNEEKKKKPFYKRIWFIVLIGVIVIGAAASLGGSDESGGDGGSPEAPKEPEKEIVYTAYDVDELVDDLEANALKAAEKYEEQYVKLKGRLCNVDASGDYIGIEPLNDEFSFTNVQCYIKNDKQLSAVKEMSTGDTIVVKGKITSVGEVLGYSLDIDSIKK